MARDVGDEQRHAVVARDRVVVEIAAELRGGDVASADGDALEVVLRRWQQAELELAGLGQLTLEAANLAAALLPQPAKLEAALDEGLQDLVVEGLLDEVERALLDGPNQGGVELVDVAGHQDDVQIGMLGVEPAHQLEPVHPGHADVQDSEVELEGAGELEGRLRAGRARHVVRPAQHAVDGAEHARIVIDHEDPGPHHVTGHASLPVDAARRHPGAPDRGGGDVSSW